MRCCCCCCCCSLYGLQQQQQEAATLKGVLVLSIVSSLVAAGLSANTAPAATAAAATAAAATASRQQQRHQQRRRLSSSLPGSCLQCLRRAAAAAVAAAAAAAAAKGVSLRGEARMAAVNGTTNGWVRFLQQEETAAAAADGSSSSSMRQLLLPRECLLFLLFVSLFRFGVDSAEIENAYPCCDIALWWHELQLPEADTTPELKAEAKAKLLEQIEKDSMAPLYRKAVEEFGWTLDEEKVKRMEAKHAEELKAIEAKLADAQENYGDTEVRDSLMAKAQLFCRIGDVPAAVEAYNVAYQKTVGIGSRLDITLTLLRIGFVYNDRDLLKKSLQTAKEEIEKGGDWERRNKLKVFEGIHLMLGRNFNEASKLFLGVLSTFPLCALVSFERFIFYACLLALLCCDRATLKEQACQPAPPAAAAAGGVVNAPPVLEGADQTMKGLLNAFYYARYQEFMALLVPIARRVKRDIYLSPHYFFFIRSIRLRAYRQYLEPYRSVTLANMATAFGVSPQFIEEEVAGFIASGKLGCRIDRVNGVVEASRPEERSRLYLQSVKQVSRGPLPSCLLRVSPPALTHHYVKRGRRVVESYPEASPCTRDVTQRLTQHQAPPVSFTLCPLVSSREVPPPAALTEYRGPHTGLARVLPE
ncbi:hypothetical protein Esti_000580 [Eimeria stiedai]